MAKATKRNDVGGFLQPLGPLGFDDDHEGQLRRAEKRKRLAVKASPQSVQRAIGFPHGFHANHGAIRSEPESLTIVSKCG